MISFGADGMFADALRVTVTSSQNDFAPTDLGKYMILVLNNTSGTSIDITGIVPDMVTVLGTPVPEPGRMLWIVLAPGSAPVVLKHNNGSSSADNRFDFFNNADASVSFAVGLIHNGIRWLQH